MRLPFRRRARARSRPTGPDVTVARRARGRAGLVVGLHGYGADETQLDTLLPLDLPVVTVLPRARHRVEPGWGWWRPEVDPTTGLTELAPAAGVDAAVAEVVAHLTDAQASEGFGADRTVLVGYSQGATLALTVAARHPELIRAVAVGAGFLLPDETVTGVEDSTDPLDVLVLNGTLDPFVTDEDHADTVDRFRLAGHRAAGRRRPVPHVIDRAQVPLIRDLVADVLPHTLDPTPTPTALERT